MILKYLFEAVTIIFPRIVKKSVINGIRVRVVKITEFCPRFETMNESVSATGSPDVVLVKLIYKQQSLICM